MLKVVHPICCGIDVHKTFIMATIVTLADPKTNRAVYKTKRFSTFNDDLARFRDWLAEEKCTELCMESTGKYWIPVYNVLEACVNITLANPKYVRAIKGKKTDKKDSVWIADLHRHGLVPGSYIPPKAVRMLRDICRYRTKLIGNRSSEKNRVQNSLTMCNIALPSVLSDTFGKTAQNIIEYVLTCEVFDPEHCKTLIDPRVKAEPEEIIRSILGYNLSLEQVAKIRIANQHLKDINERLDEVDQEIKMLSLPFQKEIKLLASIPGVTETSATYIISEIGIEMDVFHSAKHLCSWAGLAPQNNESAGKKKSTKISRAGVYLKPLLVQCANAAIKNTKSPYFREKYQALKKRRGHKKALIAICRMMLTCIYNMIKLQQEFAPVDAVTTNQSAELKAKQEQRNIQLAIAYLKKKGFNIASYQEPPLEAANSS